MIFEAHARRGIAIPSLLVINDVRLFGESAPSQRLPRRIYSARLSSVEGNGSSSLKGVIGPTRIAIAYLWQKMFILS